MTPTGAELSAFSAGKQGETAKIGTEICTPLAESSQFDLYGDLADRIPDTELAKIVRNWPVLAEDVRASILARIDQVLKAASEHTGGQSESDRSGGHESDRQHPAVVGVIRSGSSFIDIEIPAAVGKWEAIPISAASNGSIVILPADGRLGSLKTDVRPEEPFSFQSANLLPCREGRKRICDSMRRCGPT